MNFENMDYFSYCFQLSIFSDGSKRFPYRYFDPYNQVAPCREFHVIFSNSSDPDQRSPIGAL